MEHIHQYKLNIGHYRENLLLAFVAFYVLIGFFVQSPYHSALTIGIFQKNILFTIEALLFLLSFYVFGEFIFRRFPPAVYHVLIFLVLVVSYSTLMTGNKLVAVSGIRFYFRGLALFFIPLLFQLDINFVKRLLKLLITIGFIQVPISIYQYSVANKIIDYDGTRYDLVGGTFPGAGSTMLMLFIVQVLVIYIFYFYSKTKFKLFMPAAIAVLLTPVYLNLTRGIYVLIPLLFIRTLMIKHKLKHIGINLVNYLKIIAVLLVVFFVILLIANMFVDRNPIYPFNDLSALKQSTIARRATHGSSYKLGRIESIITNIKFIYSGSSTLFTGYGIGNTKQGFSENLRGKYYVWGNIRNSLASIIAELGIIGIIFFMLIFYCFYHINNQIITVFPLFSVINDYIITIAVFSLIYNDGIFSSNALHLTFLLFQGIAFSFYYRNKYIGVSFDANKSDYGRV